MNNNNKLVRFNVRKTGFGWKVEHIKSTNEISANNIGPCSRVDIYISLPPQIGTDDTI